MVDLEVVAAAIKTFRTEIVELNAGTGGPSAAVIYVIDETARRIASDIYDARIQNKDFGFDKVAFLKSCGVPHG